MVSAHDFSFKLFVVKLCWGLPVSSQCWGKAITKRRYNILNQLSFYLRINISFKHHANHKRQQTKDRMACHISNKLYIICLTITGSSSVLWYAHWNGLFLLVVQAVRGWSLQLKWIALSYCYPYDFIYMQLLRKQIPLINGHPGPICQSTGKIFNEVYARQTPEILK